MASCVFCEQRKGKRSCPALGGAICSACCGQHRLSKIQCPTDCPHLGGLAIVHDASASFTQDDYSAAVKKLLEFARVDSVDSRLAERFDGQAAEWEMPILNGYLLYGHRDAAGNRLVDRFLATRGRLLSTGVAAALRTLQLARASLFEIEQVQVGSGFDVVDLMSDEKIHIREISGTAQLKKWDILFAWVMEREGNIELTGASCFVQRAQLDRALAAIDEALEDERAEHPDVPDRDLVGSVAWAPVLALRAAYAAASKPELRTTDGEELMFCKSHYTATNMTTVRRRLAKVGALQPDAEGFVWLDRSRAKRRNETPTVLGHITLDSDGLVLETMSKERNARGRELLERTLGSAITHRADTLQDVHSAVEAHRGRAGERRDEVPEEVQRESIGTYLRDYYVRWLDEPIPALGNKTPRKAVKTKKGRALVTALLKDIENGTSKQVGGEAVDFAALRRELGLEVEATHVIVYDADYDPVPDRWIASDELERQLAIEAYHQALAVHPETQNMQLHALMHVVVENQVAGGDPPEVSATLRRLVNAGLTRHEAVHAIASVVAEALFDVVKRDRQMDLNAVRRSLERLRPEGWRFGPRP